MPLSFHHCFRAAIRVVLIPSAASLLLACTSPEERAANHYERGQELLASGQLSKAAVEFRNAVAASGDLLEALMALAAVEEELGRHESAARTYLALAERDSGNVNARVKLAMLLLGAGQLDDARKYIDEATALAPKNPQVLILQGAIKLRDGDHAEAAQLAERALSLDPNSSDALAVLAAERILNHNPDAALSLLDQGLAKNQRNIGLQLLRLKALDELGDTATVESAFERIRQLYPATPAFAISFAQWYLGKGKTAEAEAVLRQFAKDNPDDLDAQLGLVSFLVAKRGTDAAKSELIKRIDGGESASEFQIAYAVVQRQEGDDAGAVMTLEQVIAEADDSVSRNRARVELARVQSAGEDWVRAEALTNAVLDEDATNTEALGIRAWTRLAQGKFDHAETDIVAALKESPGSYRLLELLGDLYEQRGSTELALDQFGKALRLADKDGGSIAVRMANLLLRYGKVERAERVLESARLQVPGNQTVLALLAQVKLHRQDWATAQNIAEELRALSNGQARQIGDRVLAEAFAGLERTQQSMEILEASVRTGGSRGGALADLVRAYVRAAQPEKAESLLRAAIEKDPMGMSERIQLGLYYATVGKEVLAEAAFRDAVTVGPDDASGYAALAQYHLGRKEYEAAELIIRQGLERLPSNRVLQFLLAAVMEFSGRPHDAIVMYEMLQVAEPRSVVIANNLASLLSEHGKEPDSLDRAYAIASRFRTSEVPQFLDTLGWILYLRGDYSAALPLLQTAADDLPNVPEVQYHLAMVLKETGRHEASIERLLRVISLGGSEGERARDELAALRSKPPVTGDRESH